MVVTSARFLLVRVELLDARPLPKATSALSSSIRDSVRENFGDFGAGLVLSLFQSEQRLLLLSTS
jgi:hypothetical protein